MEHLYNHIHTILPSVSLATIYKNINSMTETGLLKEVALKGQKSHYEIDDEPHIHLICSQCGKIRDIHMTESELIKSVSNYTNEPVESVEITLYHTCTDCSA